MQFKTPRLLAKVMTSDWCVTVETLAAIVEACSRVKGEELILDVGKKPRKGMATASNGIAVVEASGIIGKRIDEMEAMCGGMDVDAFVDAVEESDAGTVIMHIDSPGGTVVGVPEAAERLREIGKTKTLIAYTDTLMASAGHWLGSSADSIYASPSASVGSIGVYNLSLDQSGMLEKMGIKANAIHAGDLKLMGSPYMPMTDEHRAIIQGRVDSIHKDFKKAVKRGRKDLTEEAFRGQTFTGSEAAKMGLIDGTHASIKDLIRYLTN